MVIDKRLLTKNPYSRPGIGLKTVKGIVIHYVGNAGSSAANNRDYFEGLGKSGLTYASSHYIVGLNGEIIQCVPEDEIAYASNDRNADTISIENCHPDATGKFNAKTYASLVALCADICRRYALSPLKDIIRHYDVTGKLCPLYYAKNPAEWDLLKKDIERALLAGTALQLRIDGIYMPLNAVNQNGRFYAALRDIADCLPEKQVGLRAVLEACGYQVGYIAEQNIVTADQA